MSKNHSYLRKKLPHHVIVRAPGLLPMLYKVRELANELNIPERTLRDWLACGVPYVRDKNNLTLVSGSDFATWVADMQKRGSHIRLAANEAYCLRCNEAVEVTDIETVHIQGKLHHARGKCIRCGTATVRGGSNGKSN